MFCVYIKRYFFIRASSQNTGYDTLLTVSLEITVPTGNNTNQSFAWDRFLQVRLLCTLIAQSQMRFLYTLIMLMRSYRSVQDREMC